MSLAPDEIEQERTRFEAWIRSAYAGNADLATRKGEYAEMFTWCHWTGWLAAIESERVRVRKASGELTLNEALNICGIERGEA